MSAFFRIPYQSNTYLKEQNYSIHLYLLLLRKVAVIMHGIVFHTTLQIGVLRLKVLILINPTVQWHMMTHSESTLISRLSIESLPEF